MSQPLSRRVTMIEWIALGASIALWVATVELPEAIAVVPEYMALHNALLLITAVVVFTILARHTWRRLRWWSIPLTVVALGVALLPLGIKVEELIAQLRPAPSEGFLYRSGLGICSTHVVNTARMQDRGTRLYILQEHCVPDGHGRRKEYIRRGASPFMHVVE